jgi:hypothetical protein
MTTEANFRLRARNPDVLTCIANLSNDEVFTPPEFANRMLDTLAESWAASNGGANIWADKKVRFLDPCTKSGVFLREITSRLTQGLAEEIPDLEKRVNHILTKQVFGIGITQLTSMLARRSLYCSKHAKGAHSIAKSFANDDGNIWFKRLKHTWNGDRCRFCGAGKSVFERASGLETHAYAFIHSTNITTRLTEIFGGNMQFDVIIGNPPYQLQDGGHAASAAPIYHKFIEQAMKLEPRFISMVTPSRWFQGGRGLNEFRSSMLEDGRIRVIVDFIRDKDAFPTINVNGGINYFLWDRDNRGDCQVTIIDIGGKASGPITRRLNEYDVFIRRNEALSILRKVLALEEPKFSARVSALKPFGLRTHFHGRTKKTSKDKIKLHGSGAISWVSKGEIEANRDWVDRWKVLIAAATDGNENYPLPIWDQKGPFVAGPGEACTETYLVASLASSESEAKRIVEYMRTKFFRFLVSLRKIAQHNKSDNFAFVPDLSTARKWTDEQLIKTYGLTSEETHFIDSIIRPMPSFDE